MAGPISANVALQNLQQLATLVSSGDNKGNVCYGVLQTSDGRNRVVKFAAGKKMDEAMLRSCESLRTEVGKWMAALDDAEELTHLQQGLKQFGQNVIELDKAQALTQINMSDSLGFYDDFTDPAMAHVKPLSFKKLEKALAGNEKFTYQPQKTTPRGGVIGKAVAKRSSFSNAVHAIGRVIMTATHAIKAACSGRATKNAGWNKTTADYVNKDLKMNLAELPKLNNGEDVKGRRFDAHIVASSCGLSGKIALHPFKKDASIYPNGSPSIADIKQNPDLQDCWFLSAIAATLHSLGPDAITRLIDLKTVPEMAVVRLGKRLFQVPLADVVVDGKRAVSDSAPWVRILEQAMAMFRSEWRAEDSNGNRSMSFGSSTFGLDSLAGQEAVDGMNYSTLFGLGGTSIDQIATDFFLNSSNGTEHAPLILGSRDGFIGVLASLGTGISPGHACAVLSVDSDKKRVTVLDPYGHVRHLSNDDLKHFYLVGVPKSLVKNIALSSDPNRDVSGPENIVESEREVDDFVVYDEEDSAQNPDQPEMTNANPNQRQDQDEIITGNAMNEKNLVGDEADQWDVT